MALAVELKKGTYSLSVARRAEGEKAAAPPGGWLLLWSLREVRSRKSNSDWGKRNSTNDVTRHLWLFLEFATKWTELEKGEKISENNILSCKEWIIFIQFPEAWTWRWKIEKFLSASHFLSNIQILKFKLHNQMFQYLHLMQFIVVRINVCFRERLPNAHRTIRVWCAMSRHIITRLIPWMDSTLNVDEEALKKTIFLILHVEATFVVSLNWVEPVKNMSL